MRESPRPRKKVIPMKTRTSIRQSVSKMDAFIHDTQLALCVSVIDVIALVAARAAGMMLPAWLTHPLCLAIAGAIVCAHIGFVMEIAIDERRNCNADKHIAAYNAQYDSSKNYNC